MPIGGLTHWVEAQRNYRVWTDFRCMEGVYANLACLSEARLCLEKSSL